MFRIYRDFVGEKKMFSFTPARGVPYFTYKVYFVFFFFVTHPKRRYTRVFECARQFAVKGGGVKLLSSCRVQFAYDAIVTDSAVKFRKRQVLLSASAP